MAGGHGRPPFSFPMPVFKLSLRRNAAPAIKATTSVKGPVYVEASDPRIARILAKTNFWVLATDGDGYPKPDCAWTDEKAVRCEEAAPPQRAKTTPVPPNETITCPVFRFDNGRYAQLIWWPGAGNV
ncbi:MAG: hypothetical protein AAF638_13760 [Pseudomonadota bacterium]